MKEKSCPFYNENSAELIRLEKKYADALHVLVAKGAVDDLTIEAATFLYYGGAATMATENYFFRVLPKIEKVFDNPHKERISAHTVALLYWGLLEYLNPDAPRKAIAVPFSSWFK